MGHEFIPLRPPMRPKEERGGHHDRDETKKDKEANFPLMGTPIPPLVKIVAKGEAFFIFWPFWHIPNGQSFICLKCYPDASSQPAETFPLAGFGEWIRLPERACGETGRRDRLRICWGNPWRFESSQAQNLFTPVHESLFYDALIPWRLARSLHS